MPEARIVDKVAERTERNSSSWATPWMASRGSLYFGRAPVHLVVETLSNVVEAKGVLDGLRQFFIPISTFPEKFPKCVPPGMPHRCVLLAAQPVPLDVVVKPLVRHWLGCTMFH